MKKQSNSDCKGGLNMEFTALVISLLSLFISACCAFYLVMKEDNHDDHK